MVLDILFCARDRTPERALVRPGDLAREVRDLYAPKAQRVGATLEVWEEPNVGQMWGDPQGLHALFVGLVENALDACLRDEGAASHQVIVRVKAEDQEVVWEVADDGPGMDEETQARIFSPSFSTKGPRGTGLGLLVAEKVVREHHGTIHVTSAPGQGATFQVRLPRG
jgi:signal transduction histidine kinase